MHHQLVVSSISLFWNDGFSLRNADIFPAALLEIMSDLELSIPRMCTAFAKICKDIQVLVISLSSCIAHSRLELILLITLPTKMLSDHKITTLPDSFFPNMPLLLLVTQAGISFCALPDQGLVGVD